jgi:uncharacterized phage protein (TIGR02218 family)
MSYDAIEASVRDARPFELYVFQTAEQTWRLTSGDRVRTYLSNDYTPTAMSRTEVKQTAELNDKSLKVTLPRDHDIAGLFRAYMPITPLSVVMFRGHHNDSNVVVEFTGRVSVCNMTDTCELTCAPEDDVLKRQIPTTLYQTPCNRVIFSASCGVSKDAYKVIGTVTAVSADASTITAVEFGTKPDGWFTNGFLEIGFARRMITQHTGTTVTLLTRMPVTVNVGDAVTAYAGCPRTFAACGSKFSNAPRFFGFENIPTRNPFSGLQY